MDEKRNQEANSQSFKLDENELQNLEEESRRQSECKFAFVKGILLTTLQHVAQNVAFVPKR